MTYEFSLEKPAAVKLIVGMAVVAVSLFAAGVLVGLQWNQGNQALPSASTALGVAPAPDAAEQQTTDSAASPVVADEPSPVPKQVDAPPAEPTAPPVDALAAAPTTASPTTAANQPAAPQPGGAQAKQKNEASAQPPNYSVSFAPNTGLPDVAPIRTTFVVQVGAFLKEENAQRMKEELERKGYSVDIHIDTDQERNYWYAVQLGSYVDQADARRAAANFTQQEKIKVIVRPAGVF